MTPRTDGITPLALITRSRRLRPRGLSVIEVLVGLAIAAMLLTAVAAAYSASTSMVENNDQFFRSAQTARVCMNQLLTELRRCDEIISLNLTELVIARPAEVIPAGSNEKHRIYKYQPDGRITMQIRANDDSLSPAYTLARNVANTLPFDFDIDPTTNKPVRITVTLEIRVGQSFIRLSGSATPRRNMTF